MGELKTIDLNAKEFEANSKKYFIESSLSFDRYLVYQLLQIELGYGCSFENSVNTDKKIMELCNKEGCHKGEIAILTHNKMSGIAEIEKRRVKAIEMCSLFINTENEDRKTITDEMILIKQKDWFEIEGLDIMPFFQLAMDSIKNFRKIYSEIILSSSGA